MGPKQPVDHFIDGRDSWRLGLLGFFPRIKGIALSGVITIVSMGAPWWWPNNISNQYEINLKLTITILVFMAGSAFTGSFYYLRHRSIRSLNIKYCLHQLAHDIRDRQTELHEKLASGKKYGRGNLRKELEILLRGVCENISYQFRSITGDDNVAAAIRVAVYNAEKKEICYKTFARSKGLNSQRSKNSEPISIKEGIARFLREDKKAQGVLIYNDLKNAEEVGTYKMTENDKKYKEEVCTMLVAPLNAWAGKKEDMIGILYITSRKNNTFSAVHVDQIAFAADLTANAVASSIELVRLKCLSDESKGGREYAKSL